MKTQSPQNDKESNLPEINLDGDTIAITVPISAQCLIHPNKKAGISVETNSTLSTDT